MLKTLFFLILSSLLINPPLLASDTNKIVIVRGNGDYSPYEMITDDNQLIGVHVEIVRAVAKLLKMPIEIQSLPWSRALHLMENGEADAITYIGKTLEREQFAIFYEGNVLSIVRNGFFILKEKSAEINYTGKLQQLIGYKIGTLNGYSYGDLFDSADYLTKDNGVNTEDILLNKLIRGRFVVGIANIDRMSYIATRKNSRNKITFLKPYMPGVKQYIAFSKMRRHQQLAREFAAALTTFKTTSEYRQILAKYGLQVIDDGE